MASVYAIIPMTHHVIMNKIGQAMLRGEMFTPALTTDNPSTPSSPITHAQMYDATANTTDFANYSAAKAGTALPPDVNGDPVAWGTGDIPTEAEAFAAFAVWELWANDSSRSPSVFAAEQRSGLGLSEWSPM
ncbi:hypothetical protein [Martelella sp. FOR1707]